MGEKRPWNDVSWRQARLEGVAGIPARAAGTSLRHVAAALRTLRGHGSGV